MSEAEASADELISLVGALEMGAFYGAAVADCVRRIHTPRVHSLDTPKEEFEQRNREVRANYLRQLHDRQDRAVYLAIELLRYQRWGTSDARRQA